MTLRETMIWTIKGERLIDEEDYAKAIKCFDEALKIDSRNSKVWYNRSFAQKGLKKFKNAKKCLERAKRGS